MEIPKREHEGCWSVLVLAARKSNAASLLKALGKCKYFNPVRIAEDRKEAERHLSRCRGFKEVKDGLPIELVILDLPGAATCAFLRHAKAQVPNLIVVALISARSSPAHRKEIKDAADCLQEKPRCVGEAIAFVDWLEEWMLAAERPQELTAKMLFDAAGRVSAATRKCLRSCQREGVVKYLKI